MQPIVLRLVRKLLRVFAHLCVRGAVAADLAEGFGDGLLRDDVPLEGFVAVRDAFLLGHAGFEGGGARMGVAILGEGEERGGAGDGEEGVEGERFEIGEEHGGEGGRSATPRWGWREGREE